MYSSALILDFTRAIVPSREARRRSTQVILQPETSRPEQGQGVGKPYLQPHDKTPDNNGYQDSQDGKYCPRRSTSRVWKTLVARGFPIGAGM